MGCTLSINTGQRPAYNQYTQSRGNHLGLTPTPVAPEVMIGKKANVKKVRLTEEVLDDMEWTREETAIKDCCGRSFEEAAEVEKAVSI